MASFWFCCICYDETRRGAPESKGNYGYSESLTATWQGKAGRTDGSDAFGWSGRYKLSLRCQHGRWRCGAKPTVERMNGAERKLCLRSAGFALDYFVISWGHSDFG